MKGKELVGTDSTINVNQTVVEGDLSDSMSERGKPGQKPDFDRTRQKKKYVERRFREICVLMSFFVIAEKGIIDMNFLRKL